MKKLLLLGSIALLTLIVVFPAAAQNGPVQVQPAADSPDGGMVQDATGLWFVEFASAPLADGGSADSLTSDRQNFKAAAKQANLQYTIRYDFKNLWNGV